MIEVVCLGFQKQVGKDTLAAILEREEGWMPLAFADKLKEIVQDLYSLSTEQVRGDLKEVIDPRYNMSPRTIMQRFGTEAVRAQVWDKTWTDYLFNREIPRYAELGQTKFVITDLRFQNEVDAAINFALRSQARVRLVNVVRPGINCTSDKHASENQLRSFGAWDFRVTNFGTPEQMYRQFVTHYK